MEIKTADGTYIYTIDCTPVRHYRDLYSCINEGFELTGRVGENRDALWDCLTGFIGWPCEIRLSGISSLSKQRRAELQKILDVFTNAEKAYPDTINIVYVD